MSGSLIDVATLTVGDEFTMTVTEGLLRTQISQYAGASGDFHPFHTDEVHAVAHGFDSVFGHGMHTMGLTGRLVSALAGDRCVRRFRSELRLQVWPGDALTATATVEQLDIGPGVAQVRVDLCTKNQRDETVLTGQATLEIDLD